MPSSHATTHLEAEIAPLVSRAVHVLGSSPRGATRKDLLAAMGLQAGVWPALREALDATEVIRSVGRGPGLRHIHVRFLDDVPEETLRISERGPRSQQLDQARLTLRDTLRDGNTIDSTDAQRITGLKADPVRRLLLELVDEGKLERSGKKRATRYRWVE